MTIFGVIGTLLLKGDNATLEDKEHFVSRAIVRDLTNGNPKTAAEEIAAWNADHPDDRIVFRYL